MEVPGTSWHEEDGVIEGSIGGPYMVEKIVGIYMGKVSTQNTTWPHNIHFSL